MPIVDAVYKIRSKCADGKWVAPTAIVCNDIIIGKRSSVPQIRSTYVVTVNFMYGDADGDGSETLHFHEREKAELIDFLNFLARCAAAYPHGRGGSDEYYHIDGWEKWTEGGEFVEDNPVLEWQNDPSCDGCSASFNGAGVVWYDENGIKHDCELQVEG